MPRICKKLENVYLERSLGCILVRSMEVLSGKKLLRGRSILFPHLLSSLSYAYVPWWTLSETNEEEKEKEVVQKLLFLFLGSTSFLVSASIFHPSFSIYQNSSNVSCWLRPKKNRLKRRKIRKANQPQLAKREHKLCVNYFATHLVIQVFTYRYV